MLSLEKINEIIRKFKTSSYAVPVFLLLIGIIILVLFMPPEKKPDNEKESFQDPQEYVESLEHTLKNNILKLNKVEDCSVMITVSSIDNYEYLENQIVSSSINEKDEEYSREQEYLVIDDGGEDNVVIKSKHLPEISGVLVIYDGSSDIVTKKNILDAVSTVLSIQSNKVCVLSNQE